jgi:hypothetical protein
MEYEFAPPGNHRRNQAERAIQTFKAHFIAILAGVDGKFPLSLWCHLLEPAELTLNLLRQSKSTPKISAFAHVHGHHDYMKKQFAPLGCAIQVHVKPDNRHTWDAWADSGFNLGTSMEHHRCYRVYITKTRATRISDTVAFQHQYITTPTISPESCVIAAAQQLTAALKGSIPTGNNTAEALIKVSKLFAKIKAAKKTAAAVKEQRKRLRTHPMARNPMHLPRDETPLPRVAEPESRVVLPPQADCRVSQTPEDCRVGRDVVASRQPPLPHYISQDEDADPPRPKIFHKINYEKHHARGNVVVYQPRKPKIQDHGRTNVPSKTIHDLVLRDGQLRPRGKRQTTGILPPNRQPSHPENLVALIRQRNQMSCTGNAWP